MKERKKLGIGIQKKGRKWDVRQESKGKRQKNKN